MTKIGKPDISRIQAILNEYAAMFRLSKAITYIYRNPSDEKEHIGETLCSFDTGEEGEPVVTIRVVTSVMSSVTMIAYMAPDTEPLDPEEREKVELVMRTAVSFISRNRLRDMVDRLALCDDAGFPNMRSMRGYLARHSAPDSMKGMAVAQYNLRHFAVVNQEIGRQFGNVVMKRHFEGLMQIIGEKGQAFRLGGDNFITCFDRSIQDEVLSYLSEAHVAYAEDKQPIPISASAGVFCIPDGFQITDPNDVMESVIVAMRAAQSGGKAHIIFFNKELLKQKEKSMKVQQLFPEALREEEFRVFYQPKVNIETGELSGAEALCRWFHHDRIIQPGEFIPVLESSNDICQLDLYMLRHVCMDIRRWLDEGRTPVRISVNLSRKHVLNNDLLCAIKEIIDGFSIPHHYIEIELTETTTDVEFENLQYIVRALQQEGIYTSVDDFGVGYSSLNLIRAIPWNVLKIDRSFLPLENDAPDSTRRIMFRHVVAMARDMGLECIAEGVENTAQLAVLRENNCGLAQGFLFDRPLPVEEFEKRLEQCRYQIPDIS